MRKELEIVMGQEEIFCGKNQERNGLCMGTEILGSFTKKLLSVGDGIKLKPSKTIQVIGFIMRKKSEIMQWGIFQLYSQVRW